MNSRFFQALRLVPLVALTLVLAGCQADSSSEYLLPSNYATAAATGSTQFTSLESPEVQRLDSGGAATAPSNSIAPSDGAPSILGESAIVVDYATGRVLYEKNADARRPVASTQKLLTAYIVIGGGGLDNRITVAQSDTQVEPSKVGIRAGERYSRYQLLRAMLVKSGNDIARCLARDHAGSEERFAGVMNGMANRMGMRSSNFVNASGLPAPGQYSTARDLTILGRYALRNDIIRPIVRMRSTSFQFADGRVKTLESTNDLLKESPYCIGMKTGYTRASGRCLVSAGSYRGRTVIVVVLKSNTANIWNDSRKLMHWALRAP